MVYDEKIHISLFYIRNMKTINDYADEHGWDFERRSKVNCFVKGRPYFNKSKPYTCNTLSLMKTLKESHFIPLKMSDEDVMKNNINPVFAEKDEVHAVPLNNLSTRVRLHHHLRNQYLMKQMSFTLTLKPVRSMTKH